MQSVGIIIKSMISDKFSVRFPRIYPVYSLEWKNTIRTALNSLSAFENHLSAGKMGLFLHCNIDYAMHSGALAAKHIMHASPHSEWNSVVESAHEICVRN
jgi:hypothetical protein